MKLIQILEFLTLIVEKIAFWKQAQKKEQAEEDGAKPTTPIHITAATNNEAANCSVQQNSGASLTKKARVATTNEEGAHGQ